VADELGLATRALKKELVGQGYVKRLTGVKGIPDFIVSFKSELWQPIFVELKHDNTRLHLLQAVCLDELLLYGIRAVLLNYREDGKWDVYHPPFLDKHKILRSLKTPDTTLENLTAEGLRKHNVGLAKEEKGGGHGRGVGGSRE
jgi:hypothetical protein